MRRILLTSWLTVTLPQTKNKNKLYWRDGFYCTSKLQDVTEYFNIFGIFPWQGHALGRLQSFFQIMRKKSTFINSYIIDKLRFLKSAYPMNHRLIISSHQHNLDKEYQMIMIIINIVYKLVSRKVLPKERVWEWL